MIHRWERIVSSYLNIVNGGSSSALLWRKAASKHYSEEHNSDVCDLQPNQLAELRVMH
jgi:hypothetical protein